MALKSSGKVNPFKASKKELVSSFYAFKENIFEVREIPHPLDYARIEELYFLPCQIYYASYEYLAWCKKESHPQTYGSFAFWLNESTVRSEIYCTYRILRLLLPTRFQKEIREIGERIENYDNSWFKDSSKIKADIERMEVLKAEL